MLLVNAIWPVGPGGGVISSDGEAEADGTTDGVATIDGATLATLGDDVTATTTSLRPMMPVAKSPIPMRATTPNAAATIAAPAGTGKAERRVETVAGPIGSVAIGISSAAQRRQKTRSRSLARPHDGQISWPESTCSGTV